MIRESMSAGSANAYMSCRRGRRWPSSGVRPRAGSDAGDARQPHIIPPRWLRLDRSGDTFSAYQSVDGVTWTYVAATRSSCRRTS